MRLEHRLAAVLHLVDLDVEQRIHPFVEILLGTVVGVQRYRDVRVLLGHLVCERGEGERAGDTVVHALAREICGATDGHLNDAVGFGVGETLQGGVEGLRTGHVDRGVRVAACAGGVEHVCILFRCCDTHSSIMRACTLRDRHFTVSSDAEAAGQNQWANSTLEEVAKRGWQWRED